MNPNVSLKSRREFLSLVAVGALLASSGAGAQKTPSMISRPGSGYRFLPGGQVFAAGAVALPGYEVVHALLDRWLPLEQGYELVERHLRSQGRPMHALCGMHLRLPRQLSPEGFSAFNAPYVARLKAWDLMHEGLNPVSRTNVAPAHNPPQEPSLHAFSYTGIADGAAATFTMSGMTEGGPAGIAAAGDVSPAGMQTKLEQVVTVVSKRLAELGFDWQDATHVECYAAEEIPRAMSALVARIGSASARGVRWHYARPPVIGLELELEARCVVREIVVGA